ncbi:tRNA-specific adenosine deaminase subunit tad3 [Malassezia sp. CBS 17886]|nr:tRNA-specific adenosine deaminase subunit tad3 [Malassezia sp. CBS 17886]
MRDFYLIRPLANGMQHASATPARGAPKPSTPHLNVHRLSIRDTPTAGRGVFATTAIPANTVVEISPVLLFSADEYAAHGRHTALDSYTFVWEKSTQGNTMALALGLGSLFNHHPTSANVSYELDRRAHCIRYRTVRAISPGDELCICYGAGRMWWEGATDARAAPPVSEEAECSLFASLDMGSDAEASEAGADTRGPHGARTPDAHDTDAARARTVDSHYEAPLWRVTAAPDPKTIALETGLAWAMDVPPRSCAALNQTLQELVRTDRITLADPGGVCTAPFSLRHLRSFRKAAEVQRMLSNGAPCAGDATGTHLSMLVTPQGAGDERQLTALLNEAMAPLGLRAQLYLVRVPTTPAPTRERLAEWSAVWPCVFLPPSAGIANRDAVPGSDAARATRLVDCATDAALWGRRASAGVEAAFRRCLATAAAARNHGEAVPVGVYVTSASPEELAAGASADGLHVDACDTRTSERHPLRHAVPNAIRRVADLRAQRLERGGDRSAHAGKEGCAVCIGAEDGGPYAIHEQSGLNHRFDVWRWVRPEALADGRVPSRIDTDV